MATPRSALRKAAPPLIADAAIVLGAIPSAVVMIDAGDVILYANAAAEQLFSSGAQYLCGLTLQDLLPADSPVLLLVDQARTNSIVVSEYGIAIDTPRTGHRTLTVQAAPIAEQPGVVVATLIEQSMAVKIGTQLSSRSAARSVTAMAALLAHEVKNPLSGIRGAAQLLEQGVSEEDRVLTRLIVDETDRIVALVDRMEVFSDKQPIARGAVNIHQVLEHVRRIAENGFGRHVRFVEMYDPSLPPVYGDRDQLIQVLLNLVKNAAEAVPAENGEIVMSTSYQHGVRLAVAGSDTRRHLPLMVTIQDNGPGIPEDLRPHMFDAFVTTKATGTGLGLALVAKIIGDLGGVIEFDSMPRRTVFRLMLPVIQEGDDA
jgi:two-component system, NtrC family, nitrogen regulation sensor histidine kinase GlnL